MWHGNLLKKTVVETLNVCFEIIYIHTYIHTYIYIYIYIYIYASATAHLEYLLWWGAIVT